MTKKYNLEALWKGGAKLSEGMRTQIISAYKIAIVENMYLTIDLLNYCIIKNLESSEKFDELTEIIPSEEYWRKAENYGFQNKRDPYESPDYIVDGALVGAINNNFYSKCVNQLTFLKFILMEYQIKNNVFTAMKADLKMKVIWAYCSIISAKDMNIDVPIHDAPQRRSGKRFNSNSNYRQYFKVEFGDDFTYHAFQGEFEPTIGRDKELTLVKRVLSKKAKNNVILVGESGTGKTKIVEQLAIDLVNDNVPEPILGFHIVLLNLAAIVAGSSYRGDLEEKIRKFFNSIKGKNTIVFIDELHVIEKHGGDSTWIGDALKEYLLKPELKFIGATTIGEYKILEKSPAILRRFDMVRVNAPTVLEATEILEKAKESYEKYYHLSISREAVENCVELSDRYITDTALPDKAFSVLDETCSYAKYELHAEEITREHIGVIITEKTGINISRIDENSKNFLLNFEDYLNDIIIGQNEAVEKLVKAVKKFRLGTGNVKKPIGTFLFAGPTGVGKTALAKAFTELYFCDEKALIRLDMAEYMNKESVQRMIGSPPGYVGHEEGGALTEAVKHKPFSVVLFDEIEKAHPDVLNILLQILDDGRLTDSKGKTVNFKNTIIIMTTNLGADVFKRKVVGFNTEQNNSVHKDVLKSVKKQMKPELYNRINDVIVFNPLGRKECRTLLLKYVEQYKQRMWENNGVKISFANQVIEEVITKGYSDEFGAREIIRTFDKLVESKITDTLIENEDSINLTVFVESDEVNVKVTKIRKRIH